MSVRAMLLEILCFMLGWGCFIAAWQAASPGPLTYVGVLQESNVQNEDGTFYLSTTDGKPLMTLMVPEWVASEMRPLRGKKLRLQAEDSARILQEVSK